VRELRQEVSELMALVHLIPPELAEGHVAQMDDVEVWDRFQRYTGMELSAAGPKPERNNVSSTQFSRPATMTAGLPHSTLFPELPTEQNENGHSHARFGGKATGSEVGVGR
jgi:hypothetical protein